VDRHGASDGPKTAAAARFPHTAAKWFRCASMDMVRPPGFRQLRSTNRGAGDDIISGEYNIMRRNDNGVSTGRSCLT
jgi:hypothetical protein